MKMKGIWPALVFVLTFGVFLAGCGSGGDEGSSTWSGNENSPSAEEWIEEDIEEDEDAGSNAEEAGEERETIDMSNEKPVVEITMENGGKIVIELDPEAAPLTTENFLKLVDEGFYDGLTFHRIIPNFMIQGGDPDGTGAGGLREQITGEFSQNGWTNPISHKRGTISMARTNDPNSASCQFFITNADYPSLDGAYAAFGTVISGMDVVDEISAVPTNINDRPQTPVVIATIRRK